MKKTSSLNEKLLAANPLREPLIRSAITALQPEAGSHGLDAGCGIGLQSLLLAEAVTPSGQITALDQSPALLACAAENAAAAGLSDRITFREGDIRELPFDDGSFDWAWSADCVACVGSKPMPMIRELARVTKKGGSVNIIGLSSETLLPGHSVLEAHLRASRMDLHVSYGMMNKPQRSFLRTLGMLKAAGLNDCRVQTFALGVHAPLHKDVRLALEEVFRMRWAGLKNRLKPADRDEYRRICRPKSPEFILNHPDYYAIITYSMFQGKVGMEYV